MFTYLKVAAEAARHAGQLQKERVGSGFAIQFKGDIDLVTDTDRECERLIVDEIQKAFPDHDIMAEENSYPSKGSDYLWIIDPLDGTTNFAHGYPWFAVSIALEIAGELTVGVVYNPLMDHLFTAACGKGALLNGRKIQVSSRQPLINSLLATGFPYDRTPDNENNFSHFFNFQLATRGIRRGGSAALDLASVAAGWLDGFWECKLKPWDVAAGVLLVEEAGGRVTGHDGEPYSIRNHRILASNGCIHDDMSALISGVGRDALTFNQQDSK